MNQPRRVTYGPFVFLAKARIMRAFSTVVSALLLGAQKQRQRCSRHRGPDGNQQSRPHPLPQTLPRAQTTTRQRPSPPGRTAGAAARPARMSG